MPGGSHGTSRMSKVEQFPQIHQLHLNFSLSGDDATRTTAGTIVPIVYSDEAMIASTKETNPRNATFAPMDEPNCCPQSRVNTVSGQMVMDLTKKAIETDKIVNMKIMVMPIAVSFEDIEAADEKTTTTIKAILELQSEATDRQVYPIYNGTDLSAVVGSADLGANQLGLTTDEKIEGIDFDQQQLFDALTWYTNKGKLQSSIGKIRYITLSSRHKVSVVNYRINLPKKAKSMNPYTFFGILFYIPQLGVESQYGASGDTAPGSHIHIDFRAQFNEWNPNFNMEANFA